MAQRVYSVVFSKLPQDYQLYPRNEQNEAQVPVSGIIELSGWSHMSVQVLRSNVLVKYLKAEIKYDNKGIGSFSTEATIKAELAEYSFKVYACKTADSVLMVERKNVVSGDVYVLSGQSNSTGFFTETDSSEFCRTFGKITGNLNTDSYNAADTLWALSNHHNVETGVGTMGFEIQKQLTAKSGVPNCLINAGFHWSSAYSHAIRTENNPADLTNGYGRMLYRLQKGGLVSATKAYIFRQGETEAYHEGFNWPDNFDKLYKNLKLDLPGLKKIYVCQIDIIFYASPVGAEVRDYQRRLPDIYPDIESIATVGTKDFDGLHYGREGNKQTGFEVSRLIARDLYDLKDTLNIQSPDIKKAFYKTEERKQLVLVFDDGQDLIYPDKYSPRQGVTLDMKDFFYLGGSSGGVASGKAEGNRIILELNGPQNTNTLNYLPSYVPTGESLSPFSGPYITNKLGMRAFTFYNVAIGSSLKIPVLTANAEPLEGISLAWDAVSGATQYILDRKLSTEGDFSTIAKFDEKTLSYNDLPSNANGKISYRIQALSSTSESADYGNADVEVPVVLGLPFGQEEVFSIFPNPVQKNQPLSIRINKASNGTLALINSSGQVLVDKSINQETDIIFKLSDFPPAQYFIQLKTGEKVSIKKLVIR